MSEITFRDFAGALMGNDHELAARHLGTLLGLEAEPARGATEHFVAQMKASPEFMMKAMGMRTVVEGGDKTALVALLRECFALDDVTAERSADTVLARYR